ncbi:MAG TPA: RDD family protein [Bryobacteraceae bacterium]|nr:RDD family protein [Bryobacteraceae bacterium]
MMAAAVERLEIRTPEGVVFALPLAGPVTRFVAMLIDLAAITAAGGIVDRFLSFLKPFALGQALLVVLYFVIFVGYAMIAEWLWRGQTIGKRLLGLRVMDARALHLDFSQIAIRNLLRFIDALPALYFVGGVFCFFTKHSQRLGDLAANTIVVRDVRPTQPDLTQLLGGKFNSLLEHRHLAARLRQRVPPPAASLAVDALLRREQFDPGSRLELFAQLAAYFRTFVEFPAEATEQLSDEQYVRNVAEILFSRC